FTHRWPRSVQLVLIGDRDLLSHQARRLKLPVPPAWSQSEARRFRAPVVNWDSETGRQRRYSSRGWPAGVTGRLQGRAASQWIQAATAGCLSGLFDGMITGPVCKKSLQLAGLPFPGHTEYLAALTRTRHYAMMLMGGPLRVVLATRHVPLSSVAQCLSQHTIIEATELTAQALAWLKVKNRTIGICALNPHAGDQGVLGREEIVTIIPAIRAVRRRGIQVEGPVPADVIFHLALQQRYGAILAMYHDQGLGPLKMIAFECGINLTLGLPILRTSPDHGTAFDIAGQGIAHPGSMIAAIRLAVRLARRKNPWQKSA
ncbi:MAG: 4-hydroxythreonine-4-phosphate dehydrogenase PdxA, partial [Verrucomicrobia bacterium]|nr:4-hydroxythreonine-4-phosphate dehydrogenase PdxA [Verrucomicrobiota bacterium]